MPRRPSGCPAALTLDELEAGDLAGRPEEAALRDHLRRCAACRQRAAARAADPLLSPDAETVRAVLEAGAPPLRPPLARGRARRLMRVTAAAAAGLAAAGAAAAALLAWRLHGDPAGERAKGAVALTVHVRRGPGIIDRLNGQGEVQPGQEMRFSLATSAPGHAVVLGLDASPAVTVYAPAPPEERPIAIDTPGTVTLAGSVVADRALGFERVVAVVCPSPRPVAALRRQAEIALARAGNHPEAVWLLGTGCAESSILLRKASPP
jgi:hypothetical protein